MDGAAFEAAVGPDSGDGVASEALKEVL